jgi:hypothetical protein
VQPKSQQPAHSLTVAAELVAVCSASGIFFNNKLVEDEIRELRRRKLRNTIGGYVSLFPDFMCQLSFSAQRTTRIIYMYKLNVTSISSKFAFAICSSK